MLLTLPLAGQEKLSESIEVRVVNVDVVVTDKAGKPVYGLKKDDFELYENGVRQPLSNFYEVRPGDLPVPATAGPVEAPPPPQVRARHIVIFLDDYSIEPRMRANVFAALNRFVDTQMHEGDSASIVSWSHSTQVLQPFTTDKFLLKDVISKMPQRSTIQARMEDQQVRSECLDASRVRGRGRQSAIDDCAMQIEARIDQQWAMERDLLDAMRLTMASLSGMDGKKVMVIAGAHLPEVPGTGLYQLFNELFGTSINPRIRGNHRSQSVRITDVAREANANGITLYTIDTNDARNALGPDSVEGTSVDEAFIDFSNTAVALQKLAQLTGGIAVSNTSNMDFAFDTVAQDLSSWYSLGYRPSDDKSTANRALRVKMKNPDYRVRTRQSYAMKSTEEQMTDRVTANIFHDGMRSDWPVNLHVGIPQRQGKLYRVPIEVKVPPSLTLLPAEGQKLAGGFDIYIVVGNDDGKRSNITKRAQPIVIPAAAERAIRMKPLVFNAVLMVRPGKNTISVGVIDQVTNVSGFARSNVVAR